MCFHECLISIQTINEVLSFKQLQIEINKTQRCINDGTSIQVSLYSFQWDLHV